VAQNLLKQLIGFKSPTLLVLMESINKNNYVKGKNQFLKGCRNWKWWHNQKGDGVPLQLSNKGLWVMENSPPPWRRVIHKTLRRKF